MKVYADSARADADHADRLRKSGVRRSRGGRPAGIGEGSVRRRRAMSRAQVRRCSRARRPRRMRRRSRSLRARGRGDRRAHQHGRVRVRRGRPQSALRHAEESLGSQGRAACPGGSSSGAAVAQADGMCVMALGSGHARLDPPARRALRRRRLQADAARACRARRVSAFLTLDSIGPLANTRRLLRRLRRDPRGRSRHEPARAAGCEGLRLLLPRSAALEDLDARGGEGVRRGAGRAVAGGRDDRRSCRCRRSTARRSISGTAASPAPRPMRSTAAGSTGSPNTTRASASASASART